MKILIRNLDRQTTQEDTIVCDTDSDMATRAMSIMTTRISFLAPQGARFGTRVVDCACKKTVDYTDSAVLHVEQESESA